MARLVGYFYNQLPPEIVKLLIREWNQKNQPPLPADKLERDLEGMFSRFTKEPGKYGVGSAMAEEAEILIETPENSVDDYLRGLEHRGRFEKPELPFGFKFLDELSNGLRRGSWDVFAANVKTGKTTLVLNILWNLLKLGKRVVYFSTEMSRDQVFDKLLSIATGIPASALMKGRLSESQKAQIKNFSSDFKKLSLCLPKVHQPGVKDVRAALVKYAPDVLCVDYVQYVKTVHQSRRLDVQEFVVGLSEMMAEFNAAGLVTSQLNVHRDFREHMKEIPPTLEDLPESSSIKRGARLVALMTSDIRSTEPIRPIEIEIAANRFGPVGRGFVNFHLETQRVTE
jgi:replicative DNA helicase